jgi:hypothetical protein
MVRKSEPGERSSTFGDPASSPSEEQVLEALGPAAPAWRALVSHVGRAHAPVTPHWSYSGSKYGWSLRLKRRKRVIVYLTPLWGRFLVGLVLGDRAVSAAEKSGLPETVLQALHEAPRYGEGTGLRLTVTDESLLPAIEKLILAKMS